MPSRPACSWCSKQAPDRRLPDDWIRVAIEKKFGSGGGRPAAIHRLTLCSWPCFRKECDALATTNGG